jgi:eukaryotic-like serine/threonine-protein kinase
MIGPYRLRGRLGAGGMGQVFLGLSAGGRAVAVKVIRADLATDPEFRARFRREVAVARKVSGLFTAPVIDANLDAEVPWLATAYVDGPSLAEAVSGHGPLPPGSVLALAAGLAEGLNAIHAAGVVHRDLKPANVLLAADGPRVIDFGISRAVGNSALTHTGLVVGSPGFMSPEQAEGREVGPPSDIFSLGAVLAFAATGEGPFGTGSTPALVYRVVHSPAQLEHLPALVRPLVERCLAKDPGQRPTAAGLLAGAAQPATGWLPEPVTRTFLQLPALAAAPDADTAPIPVITGPAAPNGQPTGTAAQLSLPVSSPGSRRRWRPLAAAAIIAGLLGAGATAGFALTASTSPAHATRSAQRSVAGPRIAPAGATSAPVAPASTSSPATRTSSTPAPAYMAPSTPPPATTPPPPSASPTPTTPTTPDTSPSPSTSSPASTAPASATSAPATPAGY